MRIGKEHPFGSQPIHLRRPGLRIALQHACPVIEIIDGDEQDIRLCGLAGGVFRFTVLAYCTKQQNGQSEYRCLFHCFHRLFGAVGDHPHHCLRVFLKKMSAASIA